MQARPPLHPRLPKFSQVVGENCGFDMLKGSKNTLEEEPTRLVVDPFLCLHMIFDGTKFENVLHEL